MPKILALMRARARCRTQNIDDDKKEQPDNVYKVPIPRGRFKPEMVLRGEVTSQCAQQADQQKHRADNHMKAVKSGRHEKGSTVNMAGEPKGRMLIFENLENREQNAQSDR